MRFAFVFLVGLCLLAVGVNSGTVNYEPKEPLDFSGEVTDEFFLKIFSPVYRALKIALRSVKGLNCLIKEVFNVRQAATNLLTDLQDCGGQVTKQVQSLINACNNIISTSNDLINANSNICNNDGSGDGNSKLSSSCTAQILKNMWILNKQVKTAISAIKSIPKAGAGASDCVTAAVNRLSNTLTSFPTTVISCSKLTSF